MPSPNPPRPPYPPRPGWTPGDSDRDLAARLGTDGNARAVAVLLARHWRATYDYATVCLAGPEDSARLVAAAAFHEVFGRLAQGRMGGALRPQLLVAVRNTVREWAGSEGVIAVLPELRKTVGGRGLRAARPTTPERRQLAERAFHSLPGASQCLLWHTEVEAEPLTIPAGLLGVDGITAAAGLERAREQFRAGCVRAHRELAPTTECRFYNRLLDVPLRRGGTLLPDVRRHLAQCRHCRHAAEQLSHFDGGLDVLLAETVLGWGARRYLDSRPGRASSTGTGDPTGPVRPTRGTGRHRTTPAGLLELPGGRSRKAVLVGVGLTSLALLATVLAAGSWSEDNGVPDSRATWGAPVGRTDTPGTPDGSSGRPGGAPTTASAADPADVTLGRLRATASGLCLDTAGGRAESGAAAVLAVCSSAASQRWSYQDDGLLRSAAAPTLCLAADPERGTAALAGCVVHSGEVFFDLTVRGELLLRRGEGGLVVAPGAGRPHSPVVVTGRDGSEGQRWEIDAAATGERPPLPTPAPDGAAEGPALPPAAPGPDRPVPEGAPAEPDVPQRDEEHSQEDGQEHGQRFVQVACCETPAPADAPAFPPDPVTMAGGVLEDGLGDALTAATGPLGTLGTTR
ncbi:RICIN domain-containing protein [Streptomyces sp. A012304]|uniref:RICIN domain-containing protein n=1 Tax=Streptomyces sp. A012304 TaxID=375446 RepID=UPI002231DCBA|nr:RICIN domain-containing protein [Streptomyces sp. A012304]GKQ41729.1 hydrolase [Streptomyces sp. A012304]